MCGSAVTTKSILNIAIR